MSTRLVTSISACISAVVTFQVSIDEILVDGLCLKSFLNVFSLLNISFALLLIVILASNHWPAFPLVCLSEILLLNSSSHGLILGIVLTHDNSINTDTSVFYHSVASLLLLVNKCREL